MYLLHLCNLNRGPTFGCTVLVSAPSSHSDQLLKNDPLVQRLEFRAEQIAAAYLDARSTKVNGHPLPAGSSRMAELGTQRFLHMGESVVKLGCASSCRTVGIRQIREDFPHQATPLELVAARGNLGNNAEGFFLQSSSWCEKT